MSTTLHRPPGPDQGLDRRIFEVVIDDQPLTIGFAPIAPAHSAYFPVERVLILDDGGV